MLPQHVPRPRIACAGPLPCLSVCRGASTADSDRGAQEGKFPHLARHVSIARAAKLTWHRILGQSRSDQPEDDGDRWCRVHGQIVHRDSPALPGSGNGRSEGIVIGTVTVVATEGPTVVVVTGELVVVAGSVVALGPVGLAVVDGSLEVVAGGGLAVADGGRFDVVAADAEESVVGAGLEAGIARAGPVIVEPPGMGTPISSASGLLELAELGAPRVASSAWPEAPGVGAGVGLAVVDSARGVVASPGAARWPVALCRAA